MAKSNPRRRKSKDRLATDPIAAARAADLRYVNTDEPGITRRRSGKGFTYIDANGETIRDQAERDRIEALKIPPAWTDVWICGDDRGHIQATGRDAKGRKQYRYHPRWREVRDQTKYGRMRLFGEALPRIRARARQDMGLPGLPREKVLAAVVTLLGQTLIRVGNLEYARNNDSFGLTTMRDEHVEINGATMRFEFRGKSGKEHVVDLKDRRLARIVKKCQDVPGQALFQYYDEHGNYHKITSSDVNSYLKEITGESFTAKDFRTWGGTVAAIEAFCELGDFDDEAACKKNVVTMFKCVAQHLGNTVAICRKYYVHPAIIAAYQQGKLLKIVDEVAALADAHDDLEPREAVVMALLGEGIPVPA